VGFPQALAENLRLEGPPGHQTSDGGNRAAGAATTVPFWAGIMSENSLPNLASNPIAASGSISTEELRDLGFGSVVSRQSQQRLLNRDGSFNVERRGLSFWSSLSLYHALLEMAWWRFFGLVAALYVAANAVFAGAYRLCGPQGLSGESAGLAGHDFLRAFFFSVQTLSTIGYGHIVPMGLAANILVTVESLLGLLAFTIVTGLLFARFSRPTARILFSQRAVIAPYGAIKGFEFRISNARSSQIIELEAKVLFTRFEDCNGVRTRRYDNLSLERSKVAFFPLSWTVVHPIDDESPLRGETPESLRAAQAEFLVLLTGIDETFSDTVHTRSSYIAEEIVWDARFANIFEQEPGGKRLAIDLRRLNEIVKA